MFKEEDLIIEKDYFIYKGNNYIYNNDITYAKINCLENRDTKEIYCNIDNPSFISDLIHQKSLEDAILELKSKYCIKKDNEIIEILDTEEEAKYFIDLITNKK